jgi:hypothetical protein
MSLSQARGVWTSFIPSSRKPVLQVGFQDDGIDLAAAGENVCTASVFTRSS